MILPDSVKVSAKAWVAALLVILTAVITDWTAAVEIDGRGYLGAALLATVQFAGVYFVSNKTDA